MNFQPSSTAADAGCLGLLYGLKATGWCGSAAPEMTATATGAVAECSACSYSSTAFEATAAGTITKNLAGTGT